VLRLPDQFAVKPLIQILLQSFHFAVRLVAAAVLISTAAGSAELGGPWFALAALCVLGALFAVLMAGLYVWAGWRYLRGRPIDSG
jgi:hypothetical protein